DLSALRVCRPDVGMGPVFRKQVRWSPQHHAVRRRGAPGSSRKPWWRAATFWVATESSVRIASPWSTLGGDRGAVSGVVAIVSWKQQAGPVSAAPSLFRTSATSPYQ